MVSLNTILLLRVEIYLRLITSHTTAAVEKAKTYLKSAEWARSSEEEATKKLFSGRYQIIVC